jgi:hypothetical protein
MRRQSRRRRTVAILLAMATILGVVALAVRYRTERRTIVDYLDAAKALVDQEVLLAGGLEDVFAAIGTQERPMILDRLASLATTSAGLRQGLADQVIAAPIGEANGYLSVAVAAWDDSLATLEPAVVEVLDADDVLVGEAMLQDAFSGMRVGDRAYQGFLESITLLDPQLVTQEFAVLAFVGGGRDVLYDAPVLAERFRVALNLEGDHDLALTGTVEPEPLVEDGSVPVVPLSDTFIVTLVVSNDGNLAEQRIEVAVELTPPGGEDAFSVTQILPFLEPGASTTVAFDMSDEVVPGGVYELHAAVTIAEDDTTENNTWTLVFMRNAE